jgi:hypothetical protein
MKNTQQELNEYFSNHWNSEIEKYPRSGFNLAKEVSDSERVLDVGCGHNPFKGMIKNLVGIDPAFEEADFHGTIEEYQSDELFDVAFCLGSINFGNEAKIRLEIEKIISLLKPNGRIYWRCNPARADHDSEKCEEINFFNWSLAYHEQFCKDYGFELYDVALERPEPHKKRIYAVWQRS